MSIPPSMSLSPTSFYRQHHSVEAPRIDDAMFRPGWKVRTRLDRLLLKGTIGPKEWQAGVAYRDAYTLAFGTALGSPVDRIGLGRRPERSGRASQLEHTEAQLAAVQRLAAIRQQLGSVAVCLIEALVVEDRSWTEIGRQLESIQRPPEPGS